VAEDRRLHLSSIVMGFWSSSVSHENNSTRWPPSDITLIWKSSPSAQYSACSLSFINLLVSPTAEMFLTKYLTHTRLLTGSLADSYSILASISSLSLVRSVAHAFCSIFGMSCRPPITPKQPMRLGPVPRGMIRKGTSGPLVQTRVAR
jgi:hypothetical protein